MRSVEQAGAECDVTRTKWQWWSRVRQSDHHMRFYTNAQCNESSEQMVQANNKHTLHKQSQYPRLPCNRIVLLAPCGHRRCRFAIRRVGLGRRRQRRRRRVRRAPAAAAVRCDRRRYCGASGRRSAGGGRRCSVELHGGVLGGNGCNADCTLCAENGSGYDAAIFGVGKRIGNVLVVKGRLQPAATEEAWCSDAIETILGAHDT